MSKVRDASAADAAACAAIYAPYVTGTAITFELDPPTVDEMAERIAKAQSTHAWLVLEDDDQVVGYAYAGPMKPRPAYRWSCEVSVYVAPTHHGTGAGRTLYNALFDRLSQRGYRTAVAGVTLPNPASEALHKSLGFDPIGTYRDIGWKLDSWHSVAWSQRPLAKQPDPPEEPC
jgi:L-amino acid N-acyltransferase YncA